MPTRIVPNDFFGAYAACSAPTREICLAGTGGRRTGALLATVTLLAGSGTLAMRGWRGVLRGGLRGGRFPLGRVFCSDTGGRLFLVSGLTHRPGGGCFVSAL